MQRVPTRDGKGRASAACSACRQLRGISTNSALLVLSALLHRWPPPRKRGPPCRSEPVQESFWVMPSYLPDGGTGSRRQCESTHGRPDEARQGRQALLAARCRARLHACWPQRRRILPRRLYTSPAPLTSLHRAGAAEEGQGRGSVNVTTANRQTHEQGGPGLSPPAQRKRRHNAKAVRTMFIMGRAYWDVLQTMEESRSMRIVCRPSNEALHAGARRGGRQGLAPPGAPRLRTLPNGASRGPPSRTRAGQQGSAGRAWGTACRKRCRRGVRVKAAQGPTLRGSAKTAAGAPL